MKGFKVLIFILIALLMPAAWSLNCYSCTNIEDKFCDDPFTGNSSYYGECKQAAFPSYRESTRAVCMKMVIQQKNSSEVFTKRSCRWEHEGRAKDSCKHERMTVDLKFLFCETCEDNGCNLSSRLESSSILLLAIVAALVLR